MDLQAIEIVEDRTPPSTSDEGFLKVSRLQVRNLYSDGSASEPYACDVMRRPGSDAVVAVLWERQDDGGVRVLLRESPRVPIYLRKQQRFVHPDPREYLSLLEVVAGMVEASDPPGLAGMQRRAAAECQEEAGIEVSEDRFRLLGGETFASPGVTDEKLYFCAAEAPLSQAGGGSGDGSAMEEWSRLATFDLSEAVRACRDGRIPDMKTEVALLRLCDHLAYLPSLRCFAHELPEPWDTRHTRLGVAPGEPTS